MRVKEIQLNDAQRKAVETIEGPLLVVAGPGTGKTQLLSARAKRICEVTDTDPSSILVVTFTESGVQAVRERLRKLMGPVGYRVAVHTFHGFCQRVIDDYPEKFIFARNLRSVGDFEKIELWRELIDEVRPKKLKTLGDPYFYIKDLIGSVSMLKREDITPTDFRKHTEEWIAEMEANPKLNKRTGEPIQVWKKEREQGDKSLELADFYERYQKRLRERGLYDYEDMIMMVVEKMKEDANLLADYQEKFLYMMVDEYQDTNSAQNEILKLLGSGHPDGRPNIMVVGDDDQSIYRFQGASLENILFFESTFAKPGVVVLTENYRSTQPILTASTQVIGNNQQRLGYDKNLHSNREGSLRPRVKEFGDDVMEKLWVTNEIKNKVKGGMKYSEMAVLVRTNREVKEVASFFQQQEIPIVFSTNQDVLATPVVRALLDYFSVIVDPNNDEALGRVLAMKLSGIDWLDVIRIMDYAVKRNIGRKWKISIFALLADEEEREKMGLKKGERVDNWLGRIGRWRESMGEVTLPVFFEKFLRDTDFIGWIEGLDSKVEGLRALNSFFSEVKQLSMNDHSFDLKNLVERMRVYQEYGLELPGEQFLSAREGVRVMTAHRAKGLEFPLVYIMQCVNGGWGNRRKMNRIVLPPNLMHFQKEHDPLEEERRLFYVSMTRAERELVVTYAKQYGSGDWVTEKQPSQFVAELKGVADFDTGGKSGEFDDLDFLEKRLAPISVSEEEVDFLQSKLQNYKLSVTNLETYLRCPAQFKWAHLYRLPQAKNKYMALGTVFHKALEDFFEKFLREQEKPTKEFLIERFREVLKYEVLTLVEREEMLEIGDEGLRGYFDEWQEQMVVPVANEFNFSSRNVMLGESRLTGKIDKVEPLGEVIFGKPQEVRVVDYKTGRIRTENEIRGNTKNSDGAMLRQILFYKILTNQDHEFSRKYEMVEGQLDFVEGKDGKYRKVDLRWEDAEVNELKGMIGEVWDKIMSLDFAPDPEKNKCENCQYRDLCKEGRNA